MNKQKALRRQAPKKYNSQLSIVKTLNVQDVYFDYCAIQGVY